MTEEQLKKIAPKLPLSYDVVKPLLDKYEINTPERIAAFFAQCGHESGDFKFTKENLNYSADGLRKVFGKYFKTQEHAQQCARNPEKIANIVYANRMGNGDTESGDGWKFRGRGYIQLTGKNNYTAFATFLGKTIDETVAHTETPEGGLECALFYWKNNNLNRFCDKGDQTGLCKAINGGTNGLDDRVKRYTNYISILK